MTQSRADALAVENSDSTTGSQPTAAGAIYRLISGHAPFLVGLALLLCALTFYYFAVLKIDYRKTVLLNLRPSDAAEYFAQAKALSKDGWPSLRIGYDKLPCTTPIGYPAAMLPWLKVLPQADSVLAPFRTNQTLGILLLLAVFGFYAYLAMPVSGGLAVLLLATLPVFFTFCRSSMSEITALALFISAFMFTYLGMEQQRRWKIYLAAALLGLSLNVRLQSIFFAPLLLAMALFPVRQPPLRWFLHCAGVLVVFALAASPMLIVNTIQFHSPLKSGYMFWLPDLFEKGGLFSHHNIPSNIAMLWREFALRPQRFSGANSFGTGTFFVPAFILLICVGFFFIRLNRFVICAFLGGLSFFVATICFRFPDGRYFLPLLVLLIAVAVLPVTWAAKNLVAGRRGIAAVAIFVLFAAASVGYPSRSGYKTVRTDRFQAWDALHFVDRPRQPTEFIAQRHLVEIFGRQPGIVLSDINPVYLNAILPEPFVAAPIDERHKYRYSHIWHYKRPEALALAKRGLDQSLPVYALFVSPKEMEEKSSRLPNLAGYEWEIAESAKDAVVLKLVSVAPAGR